MRPIKFRAYHKYIKEMFIPEQCLFDDKGFISSFSVKTKGDDGQYIVKNEDDGMGLELMQFTGLLDKNGMEIYEGDIIEYESYWYTYGDSGLEKVKKEVTWQNIYGAGWHFGIGHKDGEKKWSFPFPDCEVIGNIYENPDLLSNK